MVGPQSSRPLLLNAVCVAVALACGASVAPAQAAAVHATGAYAYFQPTPRDEDYAGTTVVVLRTNQALPLGPIGNPKLTGKLDGGMTYLDTVSRDLHCYTMRSNVFRKGQDTNGRVGDRVKVRLGHQGAILDRRFTVRKLRSNLPRGGPLGCGADPASKVVFFNLVASPMVEPGRIFLSANSGPYLKDITWTDWGTPTATGAGTYISDCASCGDPESYPVTLTANKLIACKPYGAKAYNSFTFERTSGATDPTADPRGISGEAEFYCK